MDISGTLPANVRWEHKLVVVLVGLPARGKSFIAHKLVNFLCWSGIRAEIFNAGKMRRTKLKDTETSSTSDFFSSSNREGLSARERIAMETLDTALSWLRNYGDVAIFDATNSTRVRRKAVLERCHSISSYLNVLFIESICDNQKVLLNNKICKIRNSPDYAGWDEEKALEDLNKRIGNYENAYETITDDNLSYIKLIDLQSKVICNRIYGSVANMIVRFLMCIHNLESPIYLVRAAQFEPEREESAIAMSPSSHFRRRRESQDDFDVSHERTKGRTIAGNHNPRTDSKSKETNAVHTAPEQHRVPGTPASPSRSNQSNQSNQSAGNSGSTPITLPPLPGRSVSGISTAAVQSYLENSQPASTPLPSVSGMGEEGLGLSTAGVLGSHISQAAVSDTSPMLVGSSSPFKDGRVTPPIDGAETDDDLSRLSDAAPHSPEGEEDGKNKIKQEKMREKVMRSMSFPTGSPLGKRRMPPVALQVVSPSFSGPLIQSPPMTPKNGFDLGGGATNSYLTPTGETWTGQGGGTKSRSFGANQRTHTVLSFFRRNRAAARHALSGMPTPTGLDYPKGIYTRENSENASNFSTKAVAPTQQEPAANENSKASSPKMHTATHRTMSFGDYGGMRHSAELRAKEKIASSGLRTAKTMKPSMSFFPIRRPLLDVGTQRETLKIKSLSNLVGEPSDVQEEGKAERFAKELAEFITTKNMEWEAKTDFKLAPRLHATMKPAKGLTKKGMTNRKKSFTDLAAAGGSRVDCNLHTAVYTSGMGRSIRSAMYINSDITVEPALNSLNTGICTGMNLDEMKAKMPEEIQKWRKDPFNYRFPGGESQQDLVIKLQSFIQEIEGQVRPVLIISHISTLQVLYGYFLGHRFIQNRYYKLNVPYDVVIELTPSQYGWKEKRYTLDSSARKGADGKRTFEGLPIHHNTNFYEECFRDEEGEEVKGGATQGSPENDAAQSAANRVMVKTKPSIDTKDPAGKRKESSSPSKTRSSANHKDSLDICNTVFLENLCSSKRRNP